MGFEFDPSEIVMNLEAIRDKMATDGQRRAVRAGAKVIAAAMVERTPVVAATNVGSDSLEPGELKENIKVRVKKIDGEAVGFAGPSGGEGRYGKAAYLVEYGHRMVSGGKSKPGADGKFHGGGKVSDVDVPAHPFLRPAFEASASDALQAMGVILAKTMKEAVK